MDELQGRLLEVLEQRLSVAELRPGDALVVLAENVLAENEATLLGELLKEWRDEHMPGTPWLLLTGDLKVAVLRRLE